ncbi:MAG TPA: hypothetical protein VFJ02_07265 [Vicinamibacterales bacterium]|nr:hypothetical protein [Vicinamibacterales bacterium]
MLNIVMTLVVSALAGAGQSSSASGSIKFTPPAGWQTRPAASSMRVAEFVLPGSKGAGQNEDAELVVYYFGGSGGSVDANIQRWLGQMQQPDGRASADVAVRDVRTINGLTISTLDLSGTYVAEVRPGATERHNSPGVRMRTAVVEAPKGPYYIKLVGPAKTVAAWNESFNEFLRSITVVP